jgi:hypothetical protein
MSHHISTNAWTGMAGGAMETFFNLDIGRQGVIARVNTNQGIYIPI